MSECGFHGCVASFNIDFTIFITSCRQDEEVGKSCKMELLMMMIVNVENEKEKGNS